MWVCNQYLAVISVTTMVSFFCSYQRIMLIYVSLLLVAVSDSRFVLTNPVTTPRSATWHFEDEGKELADARYYPHNVHPIFCGLVGRYSRNERNLTRNLVACEVSVQVPWREIDCKNRISYVRHSM
jgi:hypothetical protein